MLWLSDKDQCLLSPSDNRLKLNITIFKQATSPSISIRKPSAKNFLASAFPGRIHWSMMIFQVSAFLVINLCFIQTVNIILTAILVVFEYLGVFRRQRTLFFAIIYFIENFLYTVNWSSKIIFCNSKGWRSTSSNPINMF